MRGAVSMALAYNQVKKIEKYILLPQKASWIYFFWRIFNMLYGDTMIGL